MATISRDELIVGGQAYLVVKQSSGAAFKQQPVQIVDVVGDGTSIKVRREDGRELDVRMVDLAPDRRWLEQRKKDPLPDLRLVPGSTATPTKPGALSATLAERVASKNKAAPAIPTPASKAAKAQLSPSALRFLAVRKLRGLSVNDAAKVAGVARQTILDAESVRIPRETTLAKIAKGYQVPLDVLDADIFLGELPPWKGRARAAVAAEAPASTPDPVDLFFAQRRVATPPKPQAAPQSTSEYEAWLALTRQTHDQLTRTCDELRMKIGDHEDELMNLRSALGARQIERARLERALG